jgi:hypothetical protein
MKIYSNLADELSVWPIVQQGVGLATIAENVVRFGQDLLEHVNDIRIRTLGKRGENDLTSRECAEHEIRSLRRCCEDVNHFTDKEEFSIRDYREPNLLRRIAFIGIGCIRMIPIVGTLYSFGVICLCEKGA